MSTKSASISPRKHSCDKCFPCVTSNTSIDENDRPIPSNEMSIAGNSYVNSPSPSSIASTSTTEHSMGNRSSSLKSK
jgi:hypothetical protein